MWAKSRRDIYNDLCALAHASFPAQIPTKEVLWQHLRLQSDTDPTKAGYGVGVTPDLKYHMKLARHNSIHVSPTFLLDGLVEQQASSSWTAEYSSSTDVQVSSNGTLALTLPPQSVTVYRQRP